MLLFVPNMWTEQGKKAFIYSALTVWNTLQKDLGLVEFILLNAFKLKMKEIELDSKISVFLFPFYRKGYFKIDAV